MRPHRFYRLLVLPLLIISSYSECFIPADLFNNFLTRLDQVTSVDLGQVSETIVHEQILRRGVIASVTQFFIDNPRPGSQVSYSKLNQYYDNIRQLYFDYYGVWVCQPKLNIILQTSLEPNVAIVDLSSDTKNLPTAHFDAEMFQGSNQRVINFTNNIYAALANKDYSLARRLSGQIMHTIQDFYSHSNWIEMGNTTRINAEIGTTNFSTIPIATIADNITCVENCTLVTSQCSTFLTTLLSILDLLRLDLLDFKCPIQYFRCKDNIVQLSKLVSGYYSNQAMENGTPVPKPEPSMKCSHGGILDKDTFLPAAGGINKDAGYYMFSPHADLHLLAANLAINHSEYFYNQIRKQIGDSEYNNFLSIYVDQAQLDLAKLVSDVRTCLAPRGLESSAWLLCFLVLFVQQINFSTF